MSKHHRCPICEHRPGPRSTNNLTKSVSGPRVAKKTPCSCACHQTRVTEQAEVAETAAAS